MQNPATLEGLIAQSITEIEEFSLLLPYPPDVVSLTNPDIGYRSMEEAVSDLHQHAVMVAHTISGYGPYGGFTRWQHQFAIIIRSATITEAWEVATAIVDGHPASAGGLRWNETQINNYVDLPQGLAAYKQQIGDLEVVRIDFTLTETGA